jgi:hypothetical protein
MSAHPGEIFCEEGEELVGHTGLVVLKNGKSEKAAFQFSENLVLAHHFSQQTRTTRTDFYSEFMEIYPYLSSRNAEAKTKQTNKLHGLSPRANYTDRTTAACRRRDYQLLRKEGATWSA